MAALTKSSDMKECGICVIITITHAQYHKQTSNATAAAAATISYSFPLHVSMSEETDDDLLAVTRT